MTTHTKQFFAIDNDGEVWGVGPTEGYALTEARERARELGRTEFGVGELKFIDGRGEEQVKLALDEGVDAENDVAFEWCEYCGCRGIRCDTPGGGILDAEGCLSQVATPGATVLCGDAYGRLVCDDCAEQSERDGLADTFHGADGAIAELGMEALEVDDLSLARQCSRALDGDESALEVVRTVFENARAMDDDDN